MTHFDIQKTLKWIGVLVFALCLSACSKMTKEEYLAEYQSFVSNVIQKSEQLDEKDWTKYDDKYTKYNVELRQKFEKEFTWKDQIVLAKLELQYNLFRSKKAFKEQVGMIFKDVNEVKQQVKQYMENDMQEDLDFLIQQSKDIGGEIEKAVNETIEEMEAQGKELAK